MSLDLGTLVAFLDLDSDGFESGARRVMSQADDLEDRLPGVPKGAAALAGAIGGIVATVAQGAMQALGDLVGEAVAASDATDRFRSTLEFAGLDTSKIESLTKSTRAYADTTVYSLSDIQTITAQLAANGVADFDKLAEAAGNLNAVAGGNAETYKSVGSVLAQTAGAGRLMAENWNQLTDAIPGASGRLMDALREAGAYTGNFREAMEAGEITSEEFNAALLKLGSEPVAVEAATSVATMEGAVGNLRATVVGGLSDAISAMKPMLTDLLSGLSDTIEGVFGAIGEIVGFVQENTAWIGPLAAAIGGATAVWLAWNGALLAWQAITKIGTALQAAFNAVLAANPIMLVAIAVAALVAALVWFFTQTELGQQIWQGFMGWITAVIGGFPEWWNAIWTAVGTFFTNLWNNITAWVRGVFEGFVGWLKAIGAGVASWWNGLWQSIGAFFQNAWSGIVSWATALITGWIGGWQAIWNGLISFFSGLWANVGNAIRSAWGGILSFFGNLPNQILGFFSGVGSWLFNAGRDLINGLLRGIRSLAGTIGSFFLGLLPGWIVGPFKAALGIRSPSRVFAEYGVNTVEGYLRGIQKMQPNLDRRMGELVDAPALHARVTARADGLAGDVADVDVRRGGGGSGSSTTIIYNAAENRSLSAEEDLFAALGSPRVTLGKGGG